MGNVKRYRFKTLPNTPILKSESPEERRSLQEGLEVDLDPNGMMEVILVDDLADLEWEIRRFRRCKATILNMNLPDALLGLVRHLKSPFTKKPYDRQEAEELENLCRRWFTDEDEEAREEVAALLREHKLDESAVEAEAYRRCSAELEVVDRLIGGLEGRRNKALACLAAYRASFRVQPGVRRLGTGV